MRRGGWLNTGHGGSRRRGGRQNACHGGSSRRKRK